MSISNPDGSLWLLQDSRGIGGIESHVLALASALKGRGLPVRVVFLADHGPHPLHPLLAARGIPCGTLPGGWSGLRSALAAERPGLLHTHGYKAGVLGRLAARMLGIPCVSTYHAGEPGQGRVRLYTALDRLTARLAGGIVAVSPAIARRLPPRARVIDNFVGPPALDCGPGPDRDPPDDWPRQAAFVGRLSPEKGPDLFCALADLLPDLRPHLELVVYGDGPLRAPLERAHPLVRFAGQQPTMTGVWGRIGILCMTSRNEGLPMAALEAMAQGVPVAAFAVGGLPGLIADGENGWLVPPLDLPAFAAVLRRWYGLGDGPRQHLRAGARATIAARYTPDAVLPQLLAVYAAAGWRPPGDADRGQP